MSEQEPSTYRPFAFTVVEGDSENVTIEISEEDYQRDLAAGIDEEDTLKPGRYKMKRGGFLARHPEQAYDSEILLQKLLAKYPALLVGNQIDASSPRRWLFIERECGVPGEEGGVGRWKIDHLFLDQDAIPTLVEVKRGTDTRIRREDVGQMLDYAANATRHWPIAHIRERFAANCKASGVDPEEKLADFLGADGDSEDFWDRANKNLQNGKIRLLFVADIIPPELQRIVEFLNKQMDRTEVLAIEIKQFVGQGRSGLVPRVIGQTAEAQEKKSSGTRSTMNEAEFFESLSVDEARVSRGILDWSRDNLLHVNGRVRPLCRSWNMGLISRTIQ